MRITQRVKKILDMYGFDKVPEEIDNYIAAASA